MERRELDYRDFYALASDVKRLHEGGYDKAGEWDLSQTCQHLTTAMKQSLEGFTFKGPWFVRKIIVPLFMKGSFFKSRKIRAGLPAPDSFVFDPVDEDKAVGSFLDTLERVKQNREWRHLHPVFERLTDDQWCQFHLIHAAHHLSFLIPR